MTRDWAGYNASLVRRGEILLDLSLLRGWGRELDEMNNGRVGGRYRYPWSLMRLLGFLHIYLLPYRQLEGFTIALAKLEPRLKAPDYTTICRRVNSLNLDLDPRVDPDEDVVIALDASGMKVTNRGEWIRRNRWRAWKGYIKVHLAVDVRTKEILALEVTEERVGDGEMLEPLVEGASKRARVKRALGDGGYDSGENFTYLEGRGIEPCIRVRRNSRGRAKGCR